MPRTADDYAASARALAPVADFLVINVSSPNTPGLRDLQATARLRELIAVVRAEIAACGRSVPLLVKISPDLADEQIDAIAELAIEIGPRRPRGSQHDDRPRGSDCRSGGGDRSRRRRRPVRPAAGRTVADGAAAAAPARRRSRRSVSVGGIDTPEAAWATDRRRARRSCRPTRASSTADRCGRHGSIAAWRGSWRSAAGALSPRPSPAPRAKKKALLPRRVG